MNYALDALWWRLTSPPIRALAVLLTAPPLWHSANELPVSELLGEQGFRYLLHLNDHPTLLPADVYHPILGRYAENLLAFWLSHAPHSQLIARNQRIICPNSGKTLGELDFIVKINQQIYHIELCCKYFGRETENNWVGLNPKDTLSHKIQKLNKQLKLSQTPEAATILQKLGLANTSVRSVSVIRGNLFTNIDVPRDGVLSERAWTGTLVQQLPENTTLYRLARHEWLAPARIAAIDGVQKQNLCQAQAGIYAQLAPRPDGYWHEIARMMFKP